MVTHGHRRRQPLARSFDPQHRLICDVFDLADGRRPGCESTLARNNGKHILDRKNFCLLRPRVVKGVTFERRQPSLLDV